MQWMWDGSWATSKKIGLHTFQIQTNGKEFGAYLSQHNAGPTHPPAIGVGGPTHPLLSTYEDFKFYGAVIFCTED